MTNHINATSIFRTFNTGDLVFKEGDASEHIYYVEEGCLQVYSENRATRTEIGKVNAGEYVGELGVLQETSRNASVIALENTYVRELNKWGFIELIVNDPEKRTQLLYSLSNRTRGVGLISKKIAVEISQHKTRLSVNPIKSVFSLLHRPFSFVRGYIYSRVNSSYRRSMPGDLESGLHSIKKNRVLFHEGQDSNYACRLVSGKFRSIKSLHSGYETIGEITENEMIGEIGLLEETPRSLTVVAIENSTIEVFNEKQFLAYIYQDSTRYFALINTLSHRLVALNSHLKDITARYESIINPSVMTQARQFVRSIGDVSHLTQRMLERDLYTLQGALKLEINAVQDMLEIYYRYVSGRADKKEMEQANAEFRNFLKTLGLGAMLVIPGSFITIPLVVKLSKSLGIDVLPKRRLYSD